MWTRQPTWCYLLTSVRYNSMFSVWIHLYPFPRQIHVLKALTPYISHIKLCSPIGPNYYKNLEEVFLFFIWLQNLLSQIEDVPQDVSAHYCVFKSFLFFPLQICAGATAGYGPPSSYLCALIARRGSYISHIFLFCVLVETCSGGTAVIEVKPLAVTAPASILMEAHIIAHAIKEVQMLSGSAHIVISRRNTSLIFVVF